MNKIAKFEKVSYNQFESDWKDTFGESENIKAIYDLIQLPQRATKGSAGYDFFLPCDIVLEPQKTMKIPTGVRVRIDKGWVLQIFPRSGLGFKFTLRLNNTVGIIDSDYYFSDNEGHMFIKITNENWESKVLQLNSGDGFAQGIFLPFGICEDDQTESVRNGGLGSTSK
ncbi:MAG: dUTP diphosphatase [Anaerorhabdus sp.]